MPRNTLRGFKYFDFRTPWLINYSLIHVGQHSYYHFVPKFYCDNYTSMTLTSKKYQPANITSGFHYFHWEHDNICYHHIWSLIELIEVSGICQCYNVLIRNSHATLNVHFMFQNTDLYLYFILLCDRWHLWSTVCLEQQIHSDCALIPQYDQIIPSLKLYLEI